MQKFANIFGVCAFMFALVILIYIFMQEPTPTPQPLPDYPTGIDSSKLHAIEAYYLHQIDSLKKVVNTKIIIKYYEKTDYTKLPSNTLLDSVRKYFCTADTLL